MEPWRNRLLHLGLAQLPDELAIQLLYYRRYKRWPDLKQPRLFSERLQVLKLGERDARLPVLADKIRAKAVVGAQLGEDWIIPTLWAGKSLPASPPWKPPFVVKANHGSGWYKVFRPGDGHWPAIVEASRGWLSTRYGISKREWLYASIEPTLLVEPFIGEANQLPVDYKFWMIRGHVSMACQVVRREEPPSYKIFVYDQDWTPLPHFCQHPDEYPEDGRPASLEAMVAAARRLAEGFGFVLVDFYEVDGQPKFGELTFFPASGFCFTTRPDMDRDLGRYWDLPPLAPPNAL